MKFIHKRFMGVIGGLFLAAALLMGCGKADEAINKAKPDGQVPVSEEANKSEPVSRLSEILDPNKYSDKFTVRMFFVSHKDSAGKISSGDAMLIRTPEGKTMMIDSGFKEEISGILDQMKKLGIAKLDYILATHMHGDHVGGFPAVLDALPVDKVLSSKYTDLDLSNGKKFVAAVEAKDKKIEVLKEGDVFQLGKDVKVEVLNPEDTDKELFTGDSYSNQDLCNDQSVVIKVSYGNTSFMFTGDIQQGTEQRLVEKYGDKLKSDVLKGPHHGYNTSSSSFFLKAVKPADIIVSQALMVNNDVMLRYKNAGAKVYVTGLDGIMMAVSDGKQVTIVTEKDRKPGAIKP